MLTANRLSDGAAVYWTTVGDWAERLEDGRVLFTPSDLAQADAAGLQAQSDLKVVGAYTFDIVANHAVVRPVKMREMIRAAGPSVRLDLGKQAEA